MGLVSEFQVEAAKDYAKDFLKDGSKQLEAKLGRLSASNVLYSQLRFPTQIMWLAIRATWLPILCLPYAKAFHVLFVPVMKENLCMVAAAGYFHGKNMAVMEAGLSYLTQCEVPPDRHGRAFRVRRHPRQQRHVRQILGLSKTFISMLQVIWAPS